MRELSQFHADTKPYDWQSTIIKMIKKTSSHGGRRDFWVIVRLRSYHCLQCEGEVDVGQLHMKPLIIKRLLSLGSYTYNLPFLGLIIPFSQMVSTFST
jgi:hypothetical protein